jgi:hypothetical protein
MDAQLLNIVLTGLCTLMTMLAAGNMFWIRRLIDKIDSLEKAVNNLNTKVAILEAFKQGQQVPVRNASG